MINELYIYFSDSYDPYYNLATEQHLMSAAPACSCLLYLWQNKNTVVIGRNQNPWEECRLSLLTQDGGKLARRLSGGGAVYHDLGNLNFTFIMSEADHQPEKQLSVIRSACLAAGIHTEYSGRNDLLAEGHKFSGSAFYHSKGIAYHHGTLLINADLSRMTRYLSPPKAKLTAKGISSVRSRVINLKELNPNLTTESMKHFIVRAFQDIYGLVPQSFSLSEADQIEIRKTAESYAGEDWLFGTSLPFDCAMETRFSWGSLRLQLQVKQGYITTVQTYSDAMDHAIADIIGAALTDCPFQANAIKDALHNSTLCPQYKTQLCGFILEQLL